MARVVAFRVVSSRLVRPVTRLVRRAHQAAQGVLGKQEVRVCDEAYSPPSDVLVLVLLGLHAAQEIPKRPPQLLSRLLLPPPHPSQGLGHHLSVGTLLGLLGVSRAALAMPD